MAAMETQPFPVTRRPQLAVLGRLLSELGGPFVRFAARTLHAAAVDHWGATNH